MRDKLTDAIRIGKVSSIDAEKCTARVTFEDRGNIVSNDLPIIVPFTLKDKAYYMPAVEERVLVLFDPGAPTKGYVLGSFYADTRLPPIGDENKTYMQFEDETLVEYDKELNKLTFKITAENETSIEIETASDITVQTKGKINIESAKEISIACTKNFSFQTEADVNTDIQGQTAIQVKGAFSLKSDEPITLESKQKIILKVKDDEFVLGRE